jgi:sugar lactone lactonase YvrE
MNIKHLAVAALSVAAALPCFAVDTKFWTQNEQADFEKGKLTRLSLRSDGRLMLAPEFREVFDSAVPYLWALASDSKGNLYTGGGGPSSSTAKVFMIDNSGKGRAVAELPGMEVHAIAVNSRDQVFAATSPDGKVYRLNAAGKFDLFYDPKAKYIWAMAFDSKGNLYLATGDQGEVHRVAPDGSGSVVFKTEETHARSITVDAQDNLIVGTEPGGLILRISPNGDGFVLYQAPKREITAVAVAKDGVIYATGVGNKGGAGTVPPTFNIPPPLATPSGTRGSGSTGPETQAVKPVPSPTPSLGSSTQREASVSGGSELYRIERDNYVRKIWSQAQDIAYAIGFDALGRPVIATGNKGNIYRIDSENTSTLLINALPTQVTGFAVGPRGALFAATGNIGKVFQVGPGSEKDGTFESDPLDVGSFAYWGRLSYHGDSNSGKVLFETRSGNLDRPQKNWSAWAVVDASGRVTSPSARFLQYRVAMNSAADGHSPEIREVEIAYMAKNVAPVIEAIETTPPNYRFPPQTLTVTPSHNITLPPMGQRRRTSSTSTLSSSTTSMQYAKGQMGARWNATDANTDELLYKIEIKGVQESSWKLLRDKVKDPNLSWDSTAYPDGEYQLRITASDAPDNPPDQALSAELVSDTFLIDNTPPVIQGLAGTKTGSKLNIRWRAHDSRSVIARAEYSLNGGEWTVVEPATRLSDAPELEYNLAVTAQPGENTVAVRVKDDFDNEAVEKVIVR